jgi:hypothetical protein
VQTNRTSFRRGACSPRLLFKAIKTAKVPAVRALCLGPILTNIQVLGRVGLVFAACSGGLQVGW